MGWLGLVLAVLAPWLAGVIVVRRLLGSAHVPGYWPLAIGYGYLLGTLGSVALLALLSPLGLKAAFWGSLLILAAGAWGLGRGVPWTMRLPQARRPTWRALVASLVILWVCVRIFDLALEAWWHPVAAWDAWTTWLARAKVWAETGQLVPFVSAEEWLRDADAQVFTVAAWGYPKTISLVALWPTLAFGGWSEAIAALPWLLCAIALALGIYGQARRWGAGLLPSALAVWFLLSLPLLNAQTARAGYADLWLAAALGLSAIAMLQWARGGDRGQAALALLLAISCPFIKLEGSVWLGLLILAAAAARVPGRWLVLALVAFLAGAVPLFLGGGTALSLGPLGVLTLSPEVISVPLIGHFELGYHDSWAAVLNNVFLYRSWHLLGFFLLPAAVVGMVWSMKRGAAPWLRAEIVLVMGSFLLLFVLFFMTGAHLWAEQSTAIGRLLLHFAPVYVFYLFSIGVEWQRLAAVPSAHRRTGAVTETSSGA